jgi:hypothetical protein
MLGLTLLQSTCNLPLQRDSSTIFRWRPCAPSARRLRIAPAAFAPAEPSTAQKQKEAVDSIPVTQCPEQPSNKRENDANPVLAYLGSAISGITQLWMHQGGKANGSVALLEATAQRAAEVRKLHGHFSALLAQHHSRSLGRGRGVRLSHAQQDRTLLVSAASQRLYMMTQRVCCVSISDEDWQLRLTWFVLRCMTWRPSGLVEYADTCC